MPVVVQGAGEFARLGKVFKDLGGGRLKNETLRALRAAEKPLVEAAKAGARSTLPHGGGLADYVADQAKITARNQLTGKKVGIRLVGTRNGRTGKKVDLDSMDGGEIRHLTYGHKPWKSQSVTPGWWTDALNKAAPPVVEAVGDVVSTALVTALNLW